MKKKDYYFSILIPGWNAEPYIENCINSILNNDFENYKIIVIAGGTDKSYEIAKKFQYEHPDKIIALEQKIPHKNKALNYGLNEIKGDIIIITDIDCIYQKDWLSKINNIFQNEKFNVITGPILPYPHIKNSLAEFDNILKGEGIIRFKDSEVIIGNKLCGANAAFRKETFLNKIGRFEEISVTGDDKILGMEFNRKGEKLYYFQDIYVYTELYSNNIRKFIKHHIRWERDLFISKLSKMQILFLFFQLLVGLFKLFYPLLALILSIFFFNISYFWLFIIPWILLYCGSLAFYLFKLKNLSIQVNRQLRKNFNYKKAFKVVPLMFFIFGIITVIYLIYPKRHKW